MPMIPDAINLATVAIEGSPIVTNWTPTVNIMALSMANDQMYFSLDHDPGDSWKWMTGTGTDNYQFTLWAVVQVNGQWLAQGFIQYWQGRPFIAPSVLTHFGPDGWAGHLTSPVTAYQPKPNDTMGFFITAGNARGVTSQTSVAERSNIIAITLPSSGVGNWTFTAPSPTPPPVPPTPQPTPDPVTLDSLNTKVDAILKALANPPNYVGQSNSVPFFGQITVVLKPQSH